MSAPLEGHASAVQASSDRGGYFSGFVSPGIEMAKPEKIRRVSRKPPERRLQARLPTPRKAKAERSAQFAHASMNQQNFGADKSVGAADTSVRATSGRS
jgi:hypothetical protein